MSFSWWNEDRVYGSLLLCSSASLHENSFPSEMSFTWETRFLFLQKLAISNGFESHGKMFTEQIPHTGEFAESWLWSRDCWQKGSTILYFYSYVKCSFLFFAEAIFSCILWHLTGLSVAVVVVLDILNIEVANSVVVLYDFCGLAGQSV